MRQILYCVLCVRLDVLLAQTPHIVYLALQAISYHQVILAFKAVPFLVQHVTLV
jgi:hypothetical protein